MTPPTEERRAELRAKAEAALCSDCPPLGYPTDKTRCLPCPRRAASLLPGEGNA